MNLVLLTQSNGILKPIAKALGFLMSAIYDFVGNTFHVHNVGLTIIIFTIIIYMVLLPLTYQQQKFSKMTMIMNPELKAIQKKYRGRRDQEAQMAMQEETRAVYKKYGVSPSGSCIYLVIQLPILFALYRVIYNIPAYITGVNETFTDLVGRIMSTAGYQDTITSFFNTIKEGNYAYRGVKLDFSDLATTKDSIIDVLYKCTSSNWKLLGDTFPSFSDLVVSTQQKVEAFNHFLGINVVYSPRIMISTSFHEHHYGMIAVAILIPLISAVTQLINIRLMPRPTNGDQRGLEAQMKIMNYMMPIYSFILVIFLPTGVGLYWIAGAVIRSIQQFIINKRLDKVDMKKLIDENMKKAEEKRRKDVEKHGESGATIRNSAQVNAKNRGSQQKKSAATRAASYSSKGGKSGKSQGSSSSGPAKTYKAGSMAEKANRVQSFNQRNTKGNEALEAERAAKKAAEEARKAEESSKKGILGKLKKK